MTMVELHRLHDVPDVEFRYAVVMARHQGQWLFVRHRERTTWEIPGGRRMEGEPIGKTAERELYEETGVMGSTLVPVCAYSVDREGVRSWGMLYFSDVASIGGLPESEIAEVRYFDRLPERLTYPDIQPKLYDAGSEFSRSWACAMAELY